MEIVQALPVHIHESKRKENDDDKIDDSANSTPSVQRVELPANVTLLCPNAGVKGLEIISPLKTADPKVSQAVDKGKNRVHDVGVQKKPWADLFRDNRAPSQCAELEDMSQNNRTGVSFLEEEDLLPTKEAWGHTLIGYFAGKYPGNWGLKNLIKNWNVSVNHHTHHSGWIVFQFQDEKAMTTVLEGGPYFASQVPLLIKPIPELFKFDD